MAPEQLHSLDARELLDLAKKIQTYQDAKKLSDTALLKKFATIGSTKTYRRILTEDMAELDLEKQLNNFRCVVTLIEALGDEGEATEPLYDDLTAAQELKRVFFETSRDPDNARFVLVEGDTGMGKTMASRVLIEKYGPRLLWVEALSVWKDRPQAFLKKLLAALGVREMPASTTDCFESVVAFLNERRRAVVIDEAHHLGPQCLNTIKALINATPSEFIALAMHTLWRRLELGAYEECRQLTGNRLAERIRLTLREGDVKKILERRLPSLNGDVRGAIKLLMQNAPRRGNLSFVREVCKRARDLAEGEPITLELLSNAVQLEVAGR